MKSTSGDWLDGYDSCYVQARESWKAEIFRKLNEECNGNFFEAYSTTPFSMPQESQLMRKQQKQMAPRLVFTFLPGLREKMQTAGTSRGITILQKKNGHRLRTLCEA